MQLQASRAGLTPDTLDSIDVVVDRLPQGLMYAFMQVTKTENLGDVTFELRV